MIKNMRRKGRKRNVGKRKGRKSKKMKKRNI